LSVWIASTRIIATDAALICKQESAIAGVRVSTVIAAIPVTLGNTDEKPSAYRLIVADFL